MPPMVTVLSHTVQDMEWIVSLVDAQEAPQRKWAPFQKEPVLHFKLRDDLKFDPWVTLAAPHGAWYA